MGGIGKTQIAIEYAYRCLQKKRYTHTCWISAVSEETILTSFAELSTLLPTLDQQGEQDERKLAKLVIRWLEGCDESWLIIFDNADAIEIAAPYFPTRGHGDLLLTTRASAVGTFGTSLEVDTMGLLEGTQFLLRRAHLLDQASDDEINEASNIVLELGQFPLAIDQAGAYIEETGCSLSHYLNLYHQHRRELLARRGRHTTSYPNSVATTWSLSFQYLEQHYPAAAQCLQLSAFLAPDHIPEELLVDGAPFWAPTLQQAVTDPLRFDEMLEALLAFSLLNRHTRERQLSIHRLVQVVQVERLSPEERHQWAERLVQAVNASFPRDPQDVASWPQCLRYLEQVQACDVLIREHQFVFPEAADMLDRAGTYLFERGLYTQAASLYQCALSMREQLVGEAHPTTIQTINNLANLYARQAEFTAAETLYRRELPIVEQRAGAEPHLLIEVLRGLAHIYGDQGKYAEAELLYQRALRIWEQLVESEQVRLYGILTGLAFVQAHQGKYVEAEHLSQRVLLVLEKYLGPDHPKVAFALLGLAHITTMKKKDAQVDPLVQRALHIREQYYGLEHPLVAFALQVLARGYTGQGKYAEAEPLFQRALRIREQQLGPENSVVSNSLCGLADLYFKEGRYIEAEPLLQRALHICEQSFGPESLLLNDVLLGLANLYREQGKFAQAKLLYMRALRISEQQPEHLEMADILSSFASFQQAQGQIEEATHLYQRASLIYAHMLGADSPLTTNTQANLQTMLTTLGQTQETVQ